MKTYARVGITLALIAAFAATSLAVVNAITAPKIAQYEQKVLEAALSEVSGGYALGLSELVSDNDSIVELHYLVDDNNTTAGYILQLNGNGYGGKMTIMAGYKLDGELLDARLLANSETPGLGKKAESPSYMKKFIGHGGSSEMPIKSNMLEKSDADSVSGSTVTFSAIARTIALGSNYVKDLGVK
jgi:electron transport complex protein RnfG